MSKFLVIVESPAKSKTIKKYLGKDFDVMASYGHVRDLVPKEGAVDTDHDFEMHYQPIERNLRHVDAMAKAMKKCETIYIATDPDREGEAIAWHIQQLLTKRGALKSPALCFIRLLKKRYKMRLKIHVIFPWIWSTHNKHDARSITWWALIFLRSSDLVRLLFIRDGKLF